MPRRPEPRLTAWCYPGRMACPAGHEITRRDEQLSGELLVRCTCGRILLTIAAVSGIRGEHPVFVAEVTEQEVGWIRRNRPSVFELLELLGILRVPAPKPGGRVAGVG